MKWLAKAVDVTGTIVAVGLILLGAAAVITGCVIGMIVEQARRAICR